MSPEEVVKRRLEGLAIDHGIPTAKKFAELDQLWTQMARAREEGRRQVCSGCAHPACPRR